MGKKSKIFIRRADDASALYNFECGIKPMDDFIHDKENGLSKFIGYGLSTLWIVYENDDVIAFFSLSKDALVLNNEDIRSINNNKTLSNVLPSQGEDKFWEQEKYPAIEIDYFAVSKGKRLSHIGSSVIEFIAQQALRDEFLATMFLTVEAFNTLEYSTVTFYKKCGFEESERGRLMNQKKIFDGEVPTTLRMYRLLIPNNT